ncbi:MAG: anthranilate synthase component I family protein [Sphingobacteriaceae bacterium]
MHEVRSFKEVILADIPLFRRKALQWASSFDTACYFDSNNFTDQYSGFDLLIAAGKKAELSLKADGNAFEQLAEFRKIHTGWLPGFFGYDLKNETEKLTSSKPDHLDFPDLYFFVPEHILLVKKGSVKIISANADHIRQTIQDLKLIKTNKINSAKFESRFSKNDYLQTAEKLRQHIWRGDIYEANFCQEFFSFNTSIDPLTVFEELNRISPTPFAGYFKLDEKYIISATPERFLAKRGAKLISQPIKGTAKRAHNPEVDKMIRQKLQENTKEQAENVMIVDLVRNDLTRSALAGTVHVEELFGIYTFSQVHQMISTVVATLDPEVCAVEAIKRSFPMGSMTGAPKVRAMELIEEYERSKRGVYSGAIGYFSPEDDFDFNVVIRTVLYNAVKGYLSFQVGSAITFQADPLSEYEECLLKASAILQVLDPK